MLVGVLILFVFGMRVRRGGPDFDENAEFLGWCLMGRLKGVEIPFEKAKLVLEWIYNMA